MQTQIHMHIHIHKHKRMHVNTNKYAHNGMSTRAYIYMCIQICMYVHMCMQVCMYKYLQGLYMYTDTLHIYIYPHVCTYTDICIYIYTHIYTQTPPAGALLNDVFQSPGGSVSFALFHEPVAHLPHSWTSGTHHEGSFLPQFVRYPGRLLHVSVNMFRCVDKSVESAIMVLVNCFVCGHFCPHLVSWWLLWTPFPGMPGEFSVRGRRGV